MSYTTYFGFGFLSLLIYVLVKRSMRKPDKFPPGPPKLPMVGSLPFAFGNGKTPSLFHGSRQLVRKYGKVMMKDDASKRLCTKV